MKKEIFNEVLKIDEMLSADNQNVKVYGMPLYDVEEVRKLNKRRKELIGKLGGVKEYVSELRKMR